MITGGKCQPANQKLLRLIVYSVMNPLMVRPWVVFVLREYWKYSNRLRFLSVATMQAVIGFNFDLVMIGRFAANISISFVTFNRSEPDYDYQLDLLVHGFLIEEVESFFQLAGSTDKSDE